MKKQNKTSAVKKTSINAMVNVVNTPIARIRTNNTKKYQIENSLDRFINQNNSSHNGIIPRNELKYMINGEVFDYESPYESKLYEDNVAYRHLKKNYKCVRVRELSSAEKARLKYKMHGNLGVIVI